MLIRFVCGALCVVGLTLCVANTGHAQSKGFDFDELQAIEAIESQERQAHEAKLAEERRREKARLQKIEQERLAKIEAERKRKAEQERLAQQRAAGSSYSSSSTGGSNPRWVMVHGSCTGFATFVEKLTLSSNSYNVTIGDGSGNGSGSSQAIHPLKPGGSTAGKYGYTMRTSDDKVCSGTFSISGQRENVYIGVSCDDCRPLSIREM